MNRLKHILGVNVPRHVPATRRSHGIGINHSAQFHQGNTRLVSKRSKTICKQRSKTKSSVMLLKKSSLESIARRARHYSTHQSVKFNGNGTDKGRVLQAMINDANHVNRNGSFIATVEKQPRSYAQMIADYSQVIREASSVAAVRNDAFCFTNIVRTSLLDTLTSPLDKRLTNIARRSVVSSKGRKNSSSLSKPFNPFDQSIRYNSAGIPEATNRNHAQFPPLESKYEDRSYAKLVADCSKSAHSVSIAPNGALTPRLNVLARSSLESFATVTRNASSANISKGISRKVNRTVVETSRLSSTQLSTNISASKQPQVELHMVPSAKESVVSINVDSASTRLSSPMRLTSDELSVVVQSNQKAASSRNPSEPQHWNAATIRQGVNSALRHRDFGPMRISISEDSAPIKQIEFSINGKPVSELKSIVARTETLDVLTSSDKIEIRVPFAKNGASASSRTQVENEPRHRNDSSMEQILNVQISANFQNEPTKGSTERSHNVTKTPSPQASSTTHFFAKDSAKAPPAASNDARQAETSARVDMKTGDVNNRRVNERGVSGGTRDSGDQRKATRKSPEADKSAMDVSTVEKASDMEAGKLHAKTIRNPQYPQNKYDKNRPSDTRVPSDMIPWWSSSDGFNRMRKKKDSHKPSSWNGRKSPNISTKLARSRNDAVAVTKNSSDVISHSSSSAQREEHKPTVQYSSLFKLNPSRKGLDAIEEFMQRDFNVETVQKPVIKSDNKGISSVKRTVSVTLPASETTNAQSKYNASGGTGAHVKKTSVSSRKPKVSKDTRDSSLKRDYEKRSDHPMERTHSIDDAISAKVKEGKKVEKKKDGGHGSGTPPRKPTMKLSSDVKEIRNSFPGVMKTQDLIPNKSISDIAPKNEQINKAGTRTEWDKAEKSEAARIILKEKDNLIVGKLLLLEDVKTRDENAVKNTKGFKQDRPNVLSSNSVPKMTDTRRPEKLSSSKQSELNDTQDHCKKFTGGQMTQQGLPLPVIDTTKSSSRTKPNLTSKTQDNNVLTNLLGKNSGATPFVRRPADSLTKTREIARQSSTSGDSPSKNRQESRSRKSKSALAKRNLAESADLPSKPNGSADYKSANSRTRTRNEVKFSESREDFNRCHQPIGKISPLSHVDRPEKNALYSAWLQRFKIDVDSHEKLF